MSWYDLISPLYDIGATGSGQQRSEAVAQLRLEAGDVVLDVACGTGLNFPFVEAGIGAEGVLIGLDYSSGMLAKARRKVKRKGWGNVRLIRADARSLSGDLLKEHTNVDRIDKVLCTLGCVDSKGNDLRCCHLQGHFPTPPDLWPHQRDFALCVIKVDHRYLLLQDDTNITHEGESGTNRPEQAAALGKPPSAGHSQYPQFSHFRRFVGGPRPIGSGIS